MDPLRINVHQMAAIDLDHSFFIQLALVLILMAVLNTLIFKPFLRSIELRDGKTVDTRREAEALRARAEALQGKYHDQFAEARSEAVAQRQSVRVDAGAKKDALVGDARSAANEKLATARSTSESQVDEARKVLLGEVDDLSRLVVEKVLGRGV